MHPLRTLFAPIGAVIDYIQNHFKAMLFLLLIFLLFFYIPLQHAYESGYNLATVKLTGPIADTTETVKALEEARQNDEVKGVLLVVDSPGGAVPPSLEVAYAVKRLKASKPVVVYAKGLLASGGYYASIWADEIVANPGALVGSIGVIIHGADFQGLMEKVGFKSQVVKAGKYKQTGTADRPWTEEERAELEKVIDATYTMFVNDVAAARGLAPSGHAAYADAHIFTAAQAKAVGLVDTVGVEYDAKKNLEKRSGVEVPIWQPEDSMDEILRAVGARGAAALQLYFPQMVLK